MSENIPLVDLSDFTCGDPERHRAFVKILGEGLEKYGFVAVTGHGIDIDLLGRAYDVAVKTFALPNEVKKRYETPEDGRQRGYTSYGVEHALDSPEPDLKEFWHIGRTLPAEHPLAVRREVPPNQFPAEIPEFAPTFSAMFASVEDFALRLLDAVGEYLGKDPSFFREMVKDGNSVLRIIHYPDLAGPAPAGAIRAAQHEDINLITVLPASTQPGLELMTRDGRWIPVNAPANVMICDTGDMMQRLTAGRLPATTHRVVNPEGSDGGRMSMPFFLHPHPDHVIVPMQEGFAEPITAKEFLFQRLRAIGVA